jgi:hypothetical protein
VQHGLSDHPKLPESVFALRQQHSEKVDILDTTYHLALDGGRSTIRERERLSEEIVVLLDQIASIWKPRSFWTPMLC